MNDELSFTFFRLLPFLRAHWHDLDSVEADGRVSLEELIFAKHRYRDEGRHVWKDLVDDAIVRYPALCAAHADDDTYIQEMEKGISLTDLHAYESKVLDIALKCELTISA